LIPNRDIIQTVYKNNGLYIPSFRALSDYSGLKRKTKRPKCEIRFPKAASPHFLKELQYCKMDDEVLAYIAQETSKRRKIYVDAKENNSFVKCDCCLDDECILLDMMTCNNGHMFCQECIEQASNIASGNGEVRLKCLEQCDMDFDYNDLEQILSGEKFRIWLKKVIKAEIEKAGIENLEECPFCPYNQIMEKWKPGHNKIFSCLDPDCGIESCRLCQEPAHTPLNCQEAKDEIDQQQTHFGRPENTNVNISNPNNQTCYCYLSSGLIKCSNCQ